TRGVVGADQLRHGRPVPGQSSTTGLSGELMRILFSTIPAYGHLHPLVPLAVALREAGHTVAFATGADLTARVARFGFPTFDAGLTVPQAFQQLARRFPAGEYNQLTPDEILGWYVPHLF